MQLHLGAFWLSLKCQYFFWKEAHLFGLFLTKRNWDVCGVLLNYPHCMGKNRAKPALECKPSVFPSIFGNLQTRQPRAACNSPQHAGSFAGGLCLPSCCHQADQGSESPVHLWEAVAKPYAMEQQLTSNFKAAVRPSSRTGGYEWGCFHICPANVC